MARDRLRGAIAGPGDPIDPGAHDLIYIGGGQDRDQRIVAADMVATKRDGLASAARRTAPSCSPSAAATSCSATATSSATSGSRGSAIADLETVRSEGPRLIGNIAIEVELGAGPMTLAGFENHGGRTHLGAGAARRSVACSTGTATTARTASRGSARAT